MATAGLISLGRSLPTIFKTFAETVKGIKNTRNSTNGDVPRTQRNIDIRIVISSIVLLILLIWLLPTIPVSLPAAIIIAVICSYVLNRTRTGLHLRAVGENPATVDTAGINVIRYKYLTTCLGSMIAGLGGLYYVMDYASGVWSNNAFGDRGWLAIALVIFTVWRPALSILASILFGGLYILHLFIPTGMNLSVKELYKMLPYVVTLVVLIITSMRNKKEDQPPAALGLSYFREER